MRKAFLVLTLVAVFLGVATTIAMAADETQTINVFASSGAGIDSSNGMVHVQIGPNSRPYNFRLRYAPNPGSAFSVLPANAIVLPNAFNVEFLDGDDKLSNLNTPGTIIIKYSPSDLGGRSEATLKLMFLPEDGVVWEDLPFPSTVDTAARTVTAQFTLPGSYGLTASNAIPTAVPAPAPAPAPTAAPAPAPAPAPVPVPAPTPVPVPAAPPTFKMGFALLSSLIPGVVGQPLEEEHYGANGDSLQRTTTGLMVWRKADNWTAFTNGSTTWINGPFGLQSRPNGERFDWER